MKALELQGVGKRYLQVRGRNLLIERVLHPRRSSGAELWALRDVSLAAEPGETIGVIGRNGSGKTTLLRLLSGVSAPTVGRVTVRGRLAPLIGIGVGFNPELTGRENVDVNGRLLGMSATEVRRNFDAIVDFAEIEEFIDTPVKYYSSGMFLRLAFAVAIHTRPEVLLVDEVLAVGDIGFQVKCNDKMREIQAGGATIVIVTHNMPMLDRLAPRAVLLSRGRVVFDGPTEGAIGALHELLEATADEGTGAAPPAKIHAQLVDGDGRPQRQFTRGQPVLIQARVEFSEPFPEPRIGIMVAPAGLGACYTTHTTPGSYRGHHGPDEPLEVQVRLDNPLLAGSYTVMLGVMGPFDTEPVARTRPEPFFVGATSDAEGFVDLAARIVMAGREVRRPAQARLSGAPAVNGPGHHGSSGEHPDPIG